MDSMKNEQNQNQEQTQEPNPAQKQYQNQNQEDIQSRMLKLLNYFGCQAYMKDERVLCFTY